MENINWADILVVVLLVVFIASRFLKFSLPKDPQTGRNRVKPKGKKGDMFGRFHLEDLKMPEIKLVDDDSDKPADRKVAVWDPERLKLGRGLEGAAKIAAIDPTFDEAAFVATAKDLFARYLTVWNARDEATLATLCAPSFVGKVLRMWHSKVWAPMALADFEDVSILNTRTAGKTAVIEVAFKVRVRQGSSVRATPKTVEQRWVLARPFNSEDPTWEIEHITTGANA